MNQITLNVKKNFLSRTFSRCVAEMCPGIVKLEYHFHDNSDEVVIIRCVDGSTRRGGRHQDWISSSLWRPFWRSSTGNPCGDWRRF